MKKLLKIIAFAFALVLGLDLIWFFSTRSYLNSEAFFKKIQTPELQFAAKDGYSPWPGYFVFKELVFSGFAEDASYQIKAETLSFRFNFFQLARNRVDINGLEASEVSIVVEDLLTANGEGTVEEKAKEKERERIKKEEEEAEAKSGKDDDLWITTFSNARFTNLKEFKIASWIWTGHADVDASLKVDSLGMFTLLDSEVEAKELVITHGENKFAKIERAEIVSSIDEFNLNEKDWESILPKIESRWQLKGKLDRIESLNAYLKDLDWLALEGSSLDLDGDVGIVKGLWRDDSHLVFRANELRIKLLQQTLFGPASINWQVREKNQVELKFDKFELNKGRDGSGKGFLLTLSTADKTIMNQWKEWQAHAILPETRLHKVGFLQEYIPPSLPLKLEKGEGTLRGEFRAGSNIAKSKGDFHLKIKDLTAIYKEKLRFAFSSTAELKVERMDLAKGELAVKDAGINIDNLSFLNKKDWKGSLHLSHTAIKYEKPVYLRSHIELLGDDLQPVLAFLIQEKSLPGWILNAFDVKNPKVDFDIAATKDLLSIRDFGAKAGDLEIKGWVDQKNKLLRARFLLKLGGLTGGYGMDGDKVQWKFTHAQSWYEQESGAKL